jgi:hypothetical protein
MGVSRRSRCFSWSPCASGDEGVRSTGGSLLLVSLAYERGLRRRYVSAIDAPEAAPRSSVYVMPVLKPRESETENGTRR